jgi:hypothetical protein
MLPLSIRFKCFEVVAGRYAKIAQHPRLIQETQFSQRDILDVRRQFSAPASGPDQFRLGIGEALNHNQL